MGHQGVKIGETLRASPFRKFFCSSSWDRAFPRKVPDAGPTRSLYQTVLKRIAKIGEERHPNFDQMWTARYGASAGAHPNALMSEICAASRSEPNR